MDMEKACRIVLEQMPGKRINSILQVETGWIFGFCDVDGQVIRISPMFVNKENGEVSVYFPPDHMEELESAVEMEIPGIFKEGGSESGTKDE